MTWDITKNHIRSGHGTKPAGGSCSTVPVDETRGIQGVVTKPPGGGSMKIISFLFARNKGWDLDKAKEWFRAHNNAINSSTKVFSTNNITITPSAENRIEDESNVKFQTVCITKEGVMNNALKNRKTIQDLFDYLITYNISLPFTVEHPSPVKHVTDVSQVVGNVDNFTLDLEHFQIFGDITVSKKHPEVIKGIDEGTNADVSLGFWRDLQEVAGSFVDRIANTTYTYGLLESNLFPNHVASLTTGRGACSIKDGCGFVFALNELMNIKYEDAKEDAINILENFEPYNYDPATEHQVAINSTEENRMTPQANLPLEGNGQCPTCKALGKVGEFCTKDGTANIAMPAPAALPAQAPVTPAPVAAPAPAVTPTPQPAAPAPVTAPVAPVTPPAVPAPVVAPAAPVAAVAPATPAPAPVAEPAAPAAVPPVTPANPEVDALKVEMENMKKALDESRQQNVKETLEGAGVDTSAIDITNMSLNDAKVLASNKALLITKVAETNSLPRPASQNQPPAAPAAENIPEEYKHLILNKSPGAYLGKDEAGNHKWENEMVR